MAPYLGFTRFKRSEEYVVGESKLYNVVEADWSKIFPFQIGEGVFFRHNLSSVNYLMDLPSTSQFGIYSAAAFFFYIMAVSMDDKVSCRKDGEKWIVGLFLPDKILPVIDVAVTDFDLLTGYQPDESEYGQLMELQKMLKLSIEESDLILVMWGE